MAPPPAVIGLGVLMIVTGTINTIATKLQDRTVVGVDKEGAPVYFFAPGVQSAFMFLGEALCLAAMGLRMLSMRPASVGPIKNLLRRVDLTEVRDVIDAAMATGAQSVRPQVMDWLAAQPE